MSNAAATPRVVLLGASNLTRGLSNVITLAQQIWGRPLDVLAAFGFGRSYGQPQGIIGYQLPGLAECGLWDALAQRPCALTAALLTDIGNDLLFDVPVPQIAAWVEACLERLVRVNARIVVTTLPLFNITKLSPAMYLFFRTLLFPGCRLPLARIRERAHELDARVRDLAKAYQVRTVEPDPSWYRLDPIHYRNSRVECAWQAILSGWKEENCTLNGSRGSLGQLLYMLRLAPERAWLLGRERRHPQPAGALEDGTRLSFY